MIFKESDGRTFESVSGLSEGLKFLTGPVTDETGQKYFAKAPIQPDMVSVRNDLKNEVRWDTVVGPQLVPDFLGAPLVEAHEENYLWAVFSYIEGISPPESELGALLPIIADATTGMASMPLGRDGSNLTEWYVKRLFTNGVIDSHFLGWSDKITCSTKISSNSRLLGRMQAGIIHGDVKLKNIIIPHDDTSRLYLVDAELGTLPEKPEWDKPRFHDMAYFYHLLRCQYHRPDLAETFAELCQTAATEKLGISEAEFVLEFYLSVLERTISMMGHFIIRQSRKKIDDPRRKEHEPYAQTIHAALDVLTSS